jgi:hypothetical protein
MSHGRHASLQITAPSSPFYQGPFGRLFRNLPAWSPAGIPGTVEDHLLGIAWQRWSPNPEST